MKLYAKATSDRASKGQGGNEYINIHLYSGSEKDSRLNYTIEYKMKGIVVRDDSYKILLDTTKGKKPKGDLFKGSTTESSIFDNP